MRQPEQKKDEPRWPKITVERCAYAPCDREYIRYRRGRFCSDLCRRAAEAAGKRASYERRRPPPTERACYHCGAATMAQWYCSAACIAAGKTLGRKQARDRRRARERDAYVEDVWRTKVYRRDGYRCRLCGKPVRMTAEVPQPLAPTLDHIIPLAEGGTHEYANVQLAHFLCNSRKSHSGPGQMLLPLGGVA